MKKLLLNAGNEDTFNIQNKTYKSIRVTYLIRRSSTGVTFLWSTHISFLRSNHASQATVLLYGGDTTLLLSNSAKDHRGHVFTDIEKTLGWGAKKPDLLDSQYVPQIWSLFDIGVNTSIYNTDTTTNLCWIYFFPHF